MFAAFGLIEIALFVVFVIGMSVAVNWDRSGREEPKWVLFWVGVIAVSIWTYTTNDLTFTGVWDTIRSWEFWREPTYYLLAGVLYAAFEFLLEIRRSAGRYRESWKNYLNDLTDSFVYDENGKMEMETVNRNGNPSPKTVRITVKSLLGTDTSKFDSQTLREYKRVVSRVLQSFVLNRSSSSFVQTELNSEENGVEPRMNRSEALDWITVWILFWPFYAISLVFGDLLQEVFRVIADVFVKLSGQFMKVTFADVFKV